MPAGEPGAQRPQPGEAPRPADPWLRAELWPCSPFPQWLCSSPQELNNRLAAEITRLRTLLTGEGGGEAAGSPLTQGKDAYELEVSLQRGTSAVYPRSVSDPWSMPQLGGVTAICPPVGSHGWLVNTPVMSCIRPGDSGLLISSPR